MKQSIKKVAIPYILFLCLLGYNIYTKNFEEYSSSFVLVLLIIIIKDTLHYSLPNFSHTHKTFNYKKLVQDFWTTLSVKHIFFFINRHYIFPFLLILYLVILFLWQTHVFDIQLPKIFLWNLPLTLTIISWFFTIFHEKLDNQYNIHVKSLPRTQIHIGLSIILSVLWAYTIIIQTENLWNLSLAVSFLSGIIIFLVGISLLEDEDNKTDY